jgi:hypothetical protein
VATLISDRGPRPLESTLVVALGNSAHPAISTLSGQNKPPRPLGQRMSVLGRSGTPGGVVVGTTDRKGHAADTRVLSPKTSSAPSTPSSASTPTKCFSPQGRPTHLVSDPAVIRELM